MKSGLPCPCGPAVSYTHLDVYKRQILTYVRGGTILSDLVKSGLIELDEKGTPKNEKLMVRWRVHGVGTPKDGCWQQPSLFQAFQDWYASLQPEGSAALCMITGHYAAAAKQHQKGIIPSSGNAKLISSNDTSNFTFRGLSLIHISIQGRSSSIRSNAKEVRPGRSR